MNTVSHTDRSNDLFRKDPRGINKIKEHNRVEDERVMIIDNYIIEKGNVPIEDS